MNSTEDLNKLNPIENNLNSIAVELKTLVKELKASTAKSGTTKTKKENIEIPANFLKGLQEAGESLKGFNKLLSAISDTQQSTKKPSEQLQVKPPSTSAPATTSKDAATFKSGFESIVKTLTTKADSTIYSFLQETSKALNKNGDLYKLFDKNFKAVEEDLKKKPKALEKGEKGKENTESKKTKKTEKVEKVEKIEKKAPDTLYGRVLSSLKKMAEVKPARNEKGQFVKSEKKDDGNNQVFLKTLNILSALRSDPKRAEKRSEMSLPFALIDAIKEKREKLFPTEKEKKQQKKEERELKKQDKEESKNKDKVPDTEESATDKALKPTNIQLVSLEEINAKASKQLQEIFGKQDSSKDTKKEKSGDSFAALGKNVSSGIVSMAKGIGDAISAVAKGASAGMSAVGKGLSALGKGAGEGISAVGKGIGSAIEAIGQALPQLAVGLASLANPLTLIGLAAITAALIGIGYALKLAAPFVEAILPLFIKLADVLGNIVMKYIEAVKDVLIEVGEVIKTVFVEGLKNAAAIITSIFDGIATVISTIGDTIVEVVDGVTDGLERLGKIDGLNLYKVAGGIVAISGALALFGVGAAAGGIGNFVGGLLGKISGGKTPIELIMDFANNSDKLATAADAITSMAQSLATFQLLNFEKIADGITMIYRAITGENLDILDTIFGKSGDAVSPFEQLKDFSKTSDSISKAADALQTVADSLLLFNDVDEEKLNRILNLNFDKLASNASAGTTAPGAPVTSAGSTAPVTSAEPPAQATPPQAAPAPKANGVMRMLGGLSILPTTTPDAPVTSPGITAPGAPTAKADALAAAVSKALDPKNFANTGAGNAASAIQEDFEAAGGYFGQGSTKTRNEQILINAIRMKKSEKEIVKWLNSLPKIEKVNTPVDLATSAAPTATTPPAARATSAGSTASSALVAPGINKDNDQRNAAQLFGDEDDQGQSEIQTKETPKAASKGVSVLGKPIVPGANRKKSKSKTGPNKDIELAHELALKMGIISEGDTQVKLDIETRGNVPVLINGQKVPTELYTKQQFEQVQGALSMRKAMNMEGDNEKLKEPEVFAKEATEDVALSAEGSVQVPKTDEMSVPQARKLESQNRATAIRAKKELSKVQSKTESNIPVGQESRPMVESNNKLIEKLESLIANIRPMVRSNTSSSASLASMASNNTQATIYSNSVDRDIPYVERNKYRQQLLYVRGLL